MAYTDSEDLNYRGPLYLIGAYQTPFLSMIGGLNTGSRTNNFIFPMAQPWNLSSPSQPAITETVSAAAGTPTTITRGEDTNTVQIFKEDASVTFMKQSQYGQMSGINTNDANPVTSELGFQKNGALNQMAVDMDYSFLNGTYAAAANSTTAAKTRGVITGATSNAVAGSSAALSKDMIDELVRTMAASGAKFQNMVLFCNALQVQRITEIYGYAPPDRTIGGLAVRTILTDFATMGIVYAPNVPAATILVADLSVCKPVFVPVSFDGEDFQADVVSGSDVLWTPTAITAAQKGGFFYSQAGIDYGPEEYHGKITGLATS